MALGNAVEKEKNYINLKLSAVAGPVTKEDAPKFVKLGADFKETGETYTRVEGKLTWVKPTFTPKKGKMGDIFGFKAFIEDGDDVVVIESTITNASKDLLNAFLANKGNVISASLYLNKNGYPTASVRVGEKFAETYMPYNEIDNAELFKAIGEIYTPDKGEAELSVEDIPFK